MLRPLTRWWQGRSSVFWRRSADEQDAEIRSRSQEIGAGRTARWMGRVIAKAPATVPGDRVCDLLGHEVRLHLQAWNRTRAVPAARRLAERAPAQPHRRLAAEVFERAALSSPTIDRELLESAEAVGSLSDQGVIRLADIWAREGRRDERARRLYCAYAGVRRNLGRVDLSRTAPMRLLRAESAVDSASDQRQVRDRVLLNARLRLLHPRFGAPAVELGVAALKRGDDAGARRFLAEAADLDALPADLCLTLARLHLAAGNQLEALEYFQRAREAGALGHEVLLGTALARAQVGDMEAALKTADDAIVEGPHDARTHALRGTLALRGEAWEVARDCFDRALELDAANVEARYGAARCAEAAGNYDRATSLLAALELERPEDPWVKLALGSVADARGDLTQAIVEFRQAVKLGPSLVAPRARLGLALVVVGGADPEASEHLEDVAQHGAADDEILGALASLRARAGEHEAAIALWRRVAAPTPEMEIAVAASVHALACADLEHGEFELALARWDLLSATHQTLAPVLDGRVAALEGLAVDAIRAGSYGEAKRHLGDALRLAPDDATLRMWWGVATLQAGDLADALTDLEATAERLPLARAFAELVRAVQGEGDGRRLREVARDLGGAEPVVMCAAHIVERDVDALGDAVRRGEDSLEQVPLEGWELALATELYQREDFESVLRVTEQFSLADSGSLRAACHLQLAGAALERGDVVSAVPRLEAAERVLSHDRG